MEHSEFPTEWILMNNNDWKDPYYWLHCGMIDAVKGQLTNRFSETLKLKCLSLLEF